jgi:hypothetical protein
MVKRRTASSHLERSIGGTRLARWSLERVRISLVNIDQTRCQKWHLIGMFNDRVKSCRFNSKSQHTFSDPTSKWFVPNAAAQCV